MYLFCMIKGKIYGYSINYKTFHIGTMSLVGYPSFNITNTNFKEEWNEGKLSILWNGTF